MRCLGEEVERLDTSLASLARGEAALRLRLGQVLEVSSRSACFALGFSSVAAYALERCDRSVRWAEAARCLARRVEVLPELRGALAQGKVSWSMGELLARVAQPEDEARWLESAASHTVRQMRGLVSEALSNARRARRVEQHAARWSASACGKDGGNENDNDGSGYDDSDPNRGNHGSSYADPGKGDSRSNDGARSNDDDIDVDGCNDGEPQEMCMLSCSVTQEDGWLFEATRALLGQLGTHGTDGQLEALLAEGQGTLLAALPKGALDDESWQVGASAQRRWQEELARWRSETEMYCEPSIRDSLLKNAAPEPVGSAIARAAALGMVSLERASANELDGNVRGLARALARHELQLSRLVLQFHRKDGWLRLGYATETQYARERLGMSQSSWLAKRALALRLEKLPRVARALGAGQLGVEAAVQLVRVATPATEVAWVERARRRTIKHLREEVAAALIAVRVSDESDCPPPATAELSAFHELERAVVSGRACQPRPQSDPRVAGAVEGARHVATRGLAEAASAEPTSVQRRAWLQMLGSLAGWLESGLQTSAVPTPAAQSCAVRSPAVPTCAVPAPAARCRAQGASAGKIALRLRVSRSTYAWYRGLEAQARRWLPCGMSWLRFLCLSLWEAWRHLLGADVAYGHIYVRDRFRCMSPVCSRRDVTPHHLQFRSAGGGDEPGNIGSFCCWCHLEGVHGGRIRAWGTADDIRWELGVIGAPCLIVQGRERLAA
jgi:hypothetical protein